MFSSRVEAYEPLAELNRAFAATRAALQLVGARMQIARMT
jgi:hypothetical protein